MEHESTLFIVAEVSVGLAGFTGIVAALQGRDGWHPFDVWRVVTLLCMAFSGLFCALMPVGLNAAGLGDSIVWQLSGVFGLANMVAAYLITARYQPPEGFGGQGSFAYILVPLGAIIFGWYVLALALSSFWPFYFALFTNLLCASIEFASILLIRPN